MKKHNNIFLVGPMGAGKTSIGRQLAEALEMATDVKLDDVAGEEETVLVEPADISRMVPIMAESMDIVRISAPIARKYRG